MGEGRLMKRNRCFAFIALCLPLMLACTLSGMARQMEQGCMVKVRVEEVSSQ